MSTQLYIISSKVVNGITYYYVKFKDWNGTLLKDEWVASGGNATPPTEPVRSGYTFDSWNKSYSNIVDNIIITAVYI